MVGTFDSHFSNGCKEWDAFIFTLPGTDKWNTG
jgi:hypothetical protein